MKKDRNPYILTAVLFGILTVIYIALTVWAVAYDKPVWLVFIYVVFAVGEGILTGMEITLATSHKFKKQIFKHWGETLELLKKSEEFNKELINKLEEREKNNDGQ